MTMAFDAGAIVVAILNNWRRGVYFFLGWLLFEDFARKYLGNSMISILPNSILVAVVYLSFFAAYRRKREKDLQVIRPPFLTVMMVFVGRRPADVQSRINEHLLRHSGDEAATSTMCRCFLLGYAFMNSEADLRRFFHVNLGLMLVIIALGIAQIDFGAHISESGGDGGGDIRLLSSLFAKPPYRA